MGERVCPHCHGSIEFTSVLKAVLPTSIDCYSCGHTARVPPLWAWASVMLTVLVVVGGCLAARHWTSLPWQANVLWVAFSWLLVAYGTYIGLRQGVVPSSLQDSRVVDDEPDAWLDDVVSPYRTVDERENDDAPAPQPVPDQDTDEQATQPQDEGELQPVTATGATQAQAMPSVKVYPCIKRIAFIETLTELTGIPPASLPVYLPLFDELVLTYVIDSEQGWVTLSEATAQDYAVDVSAVHEQALDNAIDYLGSIRRFEKDGVSELVCDGEMMATAILFPALWEQVEAELGGAVVMAVPHRDTVLYAARDDNAAVSQLRTMLAGFESGDNHRISTQLYYRHGDLWQRLDQPAA